MLTCRPLEREQERARVSCKCLQGREKGSLIEKCGLNCLHEMSTTWHPCCTCFHSWTTSDCADVNAAGSSFHVCFSICQVLSWHAGGAGHLLRGAGKRSASCHASKSWTISSSLLTWPSLPSSLPGRQRPSQPGQVICLELRAFDPEEAKRAARRPFFRRM